MKLSLSQTQALNELATLLYDFLPGKAHPFANQAVSFEGVANSLELGKSWSGGSKLPAITQLLSNTLQYQDRNFCPLIIDVVQRGMAYRQSKGTPITREKVEVLNEIVGKLGFKIPELHDRKFLDSLPRESEKANEVSDSIIKELRSKLLGLNSIDPQKRGFLFEDFLKDLFAAFELAPRHSFRLIGEQIDGSLQFQGETYLIEATWQNERVGFEKMSTFSMKVGGKAQWSRGLLISYSGFSAEGLEAFCRGRPTNVICIDGLDLNDVLEGKLDLRAVIERKARRAAETNEAYVPIRELFPNIC